MAVKIKKPQPRTKAGREFLKRMKLQQETGTTAMQENMRQGRAAQAAMAREIQVQTDPHDDSVLDREMVLEDSVRDMFIANDMSKAMRANGQQFEEDAAEVFAKAYADFKTQLDDYINRKIEDAIRARTTW